MRAAVALAAAMVFLPAVVEALPTAYVVNSLSNEIGVIDLANDQVLGAIDVFGTYPRRVAFNAARGTVYVLHGDTASSSRITVINTATNEIVDEITSGIPAYGRDIVVDPAGKLLFVVSASEVTVVDCATNLIAGSIPGGGQHLAVNPAGTRLYVPYDTPADVDPDHHRDTHLRVVDVATRQVIKDIKVASQTKTLGGVAVNPAGTTVYVAVFGDDVAHVSVTLIDAVTNLVIGTLPLNDDTATIAQITFNSDGSRAYFLHPGKANCGGPGSSNNGKVKVFDPAASAVLETITIDSALLNQLAIHPDGTKAYVAQGCTQDVRVIDLATNTEIDPIPITGHHTGIAIATKPPQSAYCPAANLHARPDSIYTIGDGMVTDSTTGLTWKRCSEGQTGDQCSGAAASLTWGQALTAGATSSFAGHDDWRLPNVQELMSLVETGCFNPAINKGVFPSTSSAPYWSSTTSTESPSDAWYVNFATAVNTNYTDGKTNAHAVRLVRGGLGGCTSKPAAPTLRAPANGSTGTKRKKTLKWRDVDCETAYKVEVRNAATSALVFKADAAADATRVKVKLPAGATYSWLVSACNNIGCRKSDKRQFTVAP